MTKADMWVKNFGRCQVCQPASARLCGFVFAKPDGLLQTTRRFDAADAGSAYSGCRCFCE